MPEDSKTYMSNKVPAPRAASTPTITHTTITAADELEFSWHLLFSKLYPSSQILQLVEVKQFLHPGMKM